MAEKWADYVITRVHFNSEGTHIEEVETYEHTGTELTNCTAEDSQQRRNLNRLRLHVLYCNEGE